MSDGGRDLPASPYLLPSYSPDCCVPAAAGAREGQRKNFEALRKVLAQYTTVSDAAALPAPAAVAAAAGKAAPAAAAAEALPAAPVAAAVGLLESVVGAAACQRLHPWAAWLHGHLTALAPMLGDMVDAQLVLAVLAAATLLGALRLVIDMLLFMQHASMDPRDSIGMFTHYLFRVRHAGGGSSTVWGC